MNYIAVNWPVSESADRHAYVGESAVRDMDELTNESLGIPPVKYECEYRLPIFVSITISFIFLSIFLTVNVYFGASMRV